jgi:hypothetical protein
MTNEKVFANGVRAFSPRANAPTFVKATVVITLEELYDWAKKDGKEHLIDYNGKKQVKLALLESRDGKMYFQVDTYKPPQKEATETKEQEEEPSDDLPF